VSPGTAVTVTGTVSPAWVKGQKIPFIVERWRWVPHEGTAVVNPPGCSPPAEDTNPALCTFSPQASGRLEIDAIVNGVTKTLTKNIGVVPDPRICSSKVLADSIYIARHFGKTDFIHKQGHTGRDYALPPPTSSIGLPVYSAEAGTVVKAEYAGRAGNTVVIRGASVNSYYMHLDSYVVRYLQPVEAGDLIGYVGKTGRVFSRTGDGSHLHFEQHAPAGPPYYTNTRPSVPPRATLIQPCFF